MYPLDASMNLHNLPLFIDYFRQLQRKHKKLAGFAHGPASRIVALDRSSLSYPALWVETPTYTPEDNGAGNITCTGSGAIVILKETDGSYEQEDAAWGETLLILYSVLSRIKQENRGFTLSKKPIDPVSPMFVSNLVGWRYEFDIEEPLDLCFKAEEWEAE